MHDEPTQPLCRRGYQVILVFRPDGQIDWTLTMQYDIHFTMQPPTADSPLWQHKPMQEHLASIRSRAATTIQRMLPSVRPLWVRIEIYLVSTEVYNERSKDLDFSRLSSRLELISLAEHLPVKLFVEPASATQGEAGSAPSMFAQRAAEETGYGLYVQLVAVAGRFRQATPEYPDPDEEVMLGFMDERFQPEAYSLPDITSADEENIVQRARKAAADYMALHSDIMVEISRIFVVRLPANMFSSIAFTERSEVIRRFENFTTTIEF